MKIVVAGSTGMVGQALVPALQARGHEVWRLVRRAAVSADEVRWDPSANQTLPVVASADVVVNLAGESVASGRWTRRRMALLRESRVGTTRALVRAMGEDVSRRRVLVNASATGFYGNTGDRLVTEASAQGSGFLADLCSGWEAAALSARSGGVRVVCARFGIILGGAGALGRMVPLFRWGLGGRLGPGNQWMSWISLDDALSALVFAIESEALEGPVNFVSPQPVQNKTFTEELCRAVGRPVGLPVPSFALKLIFGKMAEETLLSSCRVAPSHLLASGFSFREAELQDALLEGLA